MALDHYVSQVHLRNFYSPKLRGQMHAIRKSDLKKFPCTSESVCRIEEGSTNAYLIEDRVIEEFLKSIEPKYNASVAVLLEGKPDSACVHAIAGFAAYVSSCAPAAMRIHSEPLESLIQTEVEILEKQGSLTKAPASLGGKSLSELLAEGTIKATIDPKFPQAVGISTILSRTSVFGNSRWEILSNPEPESPFFTSDYPVALEKISGRQNPNWIVPLAPNLAIRIVPDEALRGAQDDLTFSRFRFSTRSISHQEIRAANGLIVRSAESLVFYRDDRDWVEKFVEKNRAFRIESVTDRIDVGDGVLNISRQRLAPVKS
ncbi:MAG: DUF4238 domain-containing protein [Proteobacteria bacterium]|nr:DUF4238 domain-containing protein [Pseudomonadota bacterium]